MKSDWRTQFNRIYKSRIAGRMDRLFYKLVQMLHRDFQFFAGLQNGITVSDELLRIASNGNYDIHNGFGTCSQWQAIRGDVLKEFRFKDSVKEAGDAVWKKLGLSEDKEYVGVHFRLTDYLLVSSLCLSDKYYREALSQFDTESHEFIVFSDDIEECKKMDLWKERKAIFMPENPAALDMYLMGKCNHTIIANSSFSFWGAFLNGNENKKVVCPIEYIGDSSPENMYMNGHWYPDGWIPIDAK